MSTRQQIDRWTKLFRDKETRYGYIDSYLDSFLGMQIRVLREERQWNQTELGEKASMNQARISLLESMNYSGWSLDVLRRLAKAFDLRLVVKFEDFGSFTREYLEDFDRENLKKRSFQNDVIFNEEERTKVLDLVKHQNIIQKKTVNLNSQITIRRVNRPINPQQGNLFSSADVSQLNINESNVVSIADFREGKILKSQNQTIRNFSNRYSQRQAI